MITKQRGFNLIELMIALVIGLILMVSITTMFVDTKVSATRSSAVSELQQQAQLALQVLIADVRSIGSWGEFSGESLSDISFANIPPLAGNCSIIPTGDTITLANMHLPVTANWIVNSNAVPAAVIDAVDCLAAGYNIASNSDVLSVARIRGVTVAVGDINPNSYYLSASSQQAQLFQGAVPNGATNINNTEIYPYLHNTYFVQSHETEGTRLSRFTFIDGVSTNDVVVENIERIRIDFGVDSDRDGRANNYLASDNVTDAMWLNNQIVSARIYVLARSKNRDATHNNNQAYNARFLPFVPANNDNYRRFLLSTTVVIKNNMMAVTQ